MLPSINEETDNDAIDDEIEALEAKYKDISRDCSKQLDKLGGINKLKKIFDDLSDKLSSVYPHIEGKLGNIDEDKFGLDPERDSNDTYALKDMKAELIGHERKLKDLMQNGEKLTKCLNDMNMKKKAEEVRECMQDLKEKHSAIQEDINRKGERLDSAVSQQQNVTNRLDLLFDWITQMDDILRERRPVSLDKERLAQQLKEQRMMNAEIDSNKSLLERLSDESTDMSNNEDAQDTVFDLTER